MAKKILTEDNISNNGLVISDGMLNLKLDNKSLSINNEGELSSPYGNIFHNEKIGIINSEYFSYLNLSNDRYTITINERIGNEIQSFDYSVLLHIENKPLTINLAMGSIYPYKKLRVHSIYDVDITVQNMGIKAGNVSYMVAYPNSVVPRHGMYYAPVYPINNIGGFYTITFDISQIPTKCLNIQEFERYEDKSIEFLFY